MPTKMPNPHHYLNDPEWPGCCAVCRLIKRHRLHDPQLVAAFERDQQHHAEQVAAGQAWHRQRAGGDA